MDYPALNNAFKVLFDHNVVIPEETLVILRSVGVKTATRDSLEKKLSKALSSALRGQLEELLDILGDPPNLSKLSEEFWIKAGKELTGTIMPILQEAFILQAQEFMEEQGVSVDWTLINQDAAEWARQYSFSLVSGINKTTREALQGAIGDYFSQGWTMGDLIGKLGEYYGPVRAEMIAVTEVTRASVNGELASAAEIEKLNPAIEMIPIWNTNNDELVCPICGPYNQQTEEAWGSEYPDGPPAHPNCRCWLNHDVKVNE